jgi:ubiquinone/menaquinone biosynthesis C-methylase UbiE
LQDSIEANAFKSDEYLMESEDESLRLEIKTDPAALQRQARWCGVKPGMRLLDVGCGIGKTTALLHEMVQPGGSVVGVDFSENRINYAREHYGTKSGIEFIVHDLRTPMESSEKFDLVWVRFVLEYFRVEAREIVTNLKRCVNPGGNLCLLDLDYNCLNHYELPSQIAAILPKIMTVMDEKYNFDSFVGRKLYSFLYDNGFENIEVNLEAHHLIYGEARQTDVFNWMKKVEIGAKKANYLFNDYDGGYKSFMADFKKFFLDQRRFTYTPLLICKGVNP